MAKKRKKAEDYGAILSIILRIVLSSKMVNVEMYRALCTTLALFLVQELKWVSITPSSHKLLAHSWELIVINENYGLKRGERRGPRGQQLKLKEDQVRAITQNQPIWKRLQKL